MKNGFRLAILIRIFFLLQPHPAPAQSADIEKIDRNFFRNPLGIPVSLTANFGELRADHWHMGLDIRTNRKENYRVYAAADGYIALMGIRPLGFGKYIVINHSNGLSTLYAHLNSFFPALDAYVAQKQKEQESWAIELNVPANRFPVRKGDAIALSGNTGGSMGPHLHFEIRKTATGECLNPLLFDFGVKDNIFPAITRLALYDRSKSIYEQNPQLFSIKKMGNHYISNPGHIKTGYKKLSFAIEALDKVSGSANPNGIYSASVFFDEKQLVRFELKEIGYGHTLYMNAHIDYKHKSGGGGYVQHLSVLPGDKGPAYSKINGPGIIELKDTVVHKIRIEAKDIFGNVSELEFTLQYDKMADKSVNNHEAVTRFFPNAANVYETSDFQINTTEKCLYDTIYLRYQRENNSEEGAVTALHRLNEPSIPVHDPFIVKLKPLTSVREKFKNKTVIVRTWKSFRSARKAVWEGDWMTAKMGDFGYFQGFIDSIPPSLNDPGAINNNDTLDLSKAGRIVFTPIDNFGIRSFRAELDGKWLMFSNDKGKSFVYIFDEQCPYGIHELKVKVEDIVGNITERRWVFKRYEYKPPVKRTGVKK